MLCRLNPHRGHFCWKWSSVALSFDLVFFLCDLSFFFFILYPWWVGWSNMSSLAGYGKLWFPFEIAAGKLWWVQSIVFFSCSALEIRAIGIISSASPSHFHEKWDCCPLEWHKGKWSVVTLVLEWGAVVRRLGCPKKVLLVSVKSFYNQVEASNGKTRICQDTLFDVIYKAVLSLWEE